MARCVSAETHTHFTYAEGATVSGMRVYYLETRKRTTTRESSSEYRRSVEEIKLMRLWPSSALSICQYTDRHPVHLLHFLTVSASLLSTLKNEILFLCSACGYLIVRVSDSLSLGYGERKGVSSETAMTLCRLAECSVPMAGGGGGGGGGAAAHLPSPSLSTQQANTLCCTRHPGTYTASQVFNAVSSDIV